MTNKAGLGLTVLFVAGMLGVAAPAVAEETGSSIAEQGATLPHDQALKLLGEALGQSVSATQADPSIPDILRALDNSIAATREIREMVEAGDKVSDEQMAEVAKRIDGIAKSFRAISDLAPDVFNRRMAELSDIDAIGEVIGFRIADARARIVALKAQNAEIDKQLRANTLSHSQIEMMRLTRRANEAEVRSVEAAISAWTYFSERHTAVMARLADQSDDLQVFFHALRENARVYEAAAQTLGIANSLKLALRDLSTVENLNALRSELVESWDDLMKIVEEVNGGLQLDPGM